jgi:hypothetical protein
MDARAGNVTGRVGAQARLGNFVVGPGCVFNTIGEAPVLVGINGLHKERMLQTSFQPAADIAMLLRHMNFLTNMKPE